MIDFVMKLGLDKAMIGFIGSFIFFRIRFNFDRNKLHAELANES